MKLDKKKAEVNHNNPCVDIVFCIIPKQLERLVDAQSKGEAELLVRDEVKFEKHIFKSLVE
jgi:hypothetical protein